jgi:hypothetical protein
MKQKLTFILFMCLVLNVTKAQSTCGYSDYATIKSSLLTAYAPNLTMNAYYKFNDSIKFIGTPQMDTNQWFAFTGYSMPSASMFFVNDSLIFSFSLSTDTSETSYYPQEIKFYQKYISANSGFDTFTIEFKSYVYFTPWRKVEIWSAGDFNRIGREWTLNPFNENEPTKVFFSQSLVPTCNINYLIGWCPHLLIRKIQY